MAEEMRFHLEQRAADLASDGIPATDARYAAERQFGNVGRIQEEARDAQRWGSLERALKDFRFAVRQLIRAPGFSLLAVVTLGLGIGANTAMFSVLNGVLLRPLPYPEPTQLDRFYRVTAQNPKGHFSAADWLDLQRAKDSYGELAAYTARDVSLAEPGQPAEMAYAARATANLLTLLGIPPQLGRNFRTTEDTPGSDRVVILSQRTWLNRFGGKPDIIGHSVRVDGAPHEVIGVMPASFNDWRHLGMIDVFVPIALTPEQGANRADTLLRIVGRRSPVRPPAEATAFAANFGARLATDFPQANAESSWRLVSLQRAAGGSGGTTIVPMLIGLSGFVLLIACSNLANLLLARTMARAREFAVRAALGASRTQLLRPLIAESLLLSLAGGTCAIFVTLWFRDWAAFRSTGENGEQVLFALDWPVFGWAFGASLVTALAFGLAPALFALRLDLNHTLKSGGRGTTGGRGPQRFRQILIVGQFALAMVLLAGAGLFIRGLYDLNHRRAGWQSDHLVTGTILLPAATYADSDQIAAFHRLALERLGALPGVAAVSFSSFTPIVDWPEIRKFLAEGQQRPPVGREPGAMVNTVSHQYFDTVGTRLLSGRTFLARDTAMAPSVFIVSQSTARGLFGEENPIGRRLGKLTGENVQWGEIVGVVGDVQPIDPEPSPVAFQIYQPMTQDPRRRSELALRSHGAIPASLVEDIRAAMADLDPDLPVRRLQPAHLTIDRVNYQLAVLRDILGAIALLGLGLASLGIYGIIARTMAQRSGEFAIRLALGASIGNLTRIVLASGVKLALVGSALGLFGAFGVARVLAAAFPGMQTNGVIVLLATTVLLVAVALIACWLPARRAGQVDAMAALRAE